MVIGRECNYKKIFLVLAFFFLFLFSLGFLGHNVFAADPPVNQDPGGTHNGGSGEPVDGCSSIIYINHILALLGFTMILTKWASQ